MGKMYIEFQIFSQDKLVLVSGRWRLVAGCWQLVALDTR
jgi:hypothetical protein